MIEQVPNQIPPAAAPPSRWKGLFQNKYHPVPTYLSTITIYAAFAITFLVIGIILFKANNEIKEFKLKHYNEMSCTGTVCNYTLTVDKKMNGPVEVLYELEGYYQNHRRYIQSKSNHQLSGREISHLDADRACSPIIYNKDIGKELSWGGHPLDPEAIASPCGLIAKSFFNDTYRLYGPNNQPVQIQQNDIAWQNDRGKKYKRSMNSARQQWIDPENEHFIVWMRTAGLTNFKKLWGRVHNDLEPGNYTIQVENNYNVSQYHADKTFILTTTNWVGGKNILLPLMFIVLFTVCVVVCLLFMLKYRGLQTLKQDRTA